MAKGQETLEQRASALREILSKPSEKELAAIELKRIEAEIAGQREAAGRDAAKERIVAIKRAHGSLVASFDADEARVRTAAAELGEAVLRFNQRFMQVATLKAEAEALCGRFGLKAPELSAGLPPARRGIDVQTVTLTDHVRGPMEATEKCEYGLRTRRSYGEIAGTEGYAIIQSAGLAPFPPLTEQQQRMVTSKEQERQRDRENMSRMRETDHDSRLYLVGSITKPQSKD